MPDLVMRRLGRRLADERGITLSEMVASMIVLGLFLGAFSLVISSAVRHTGETEGQTALQREARQALDVLARDLRQAYSGTPGTSFIETSSATQLTFLSPDRAQPFHLRRISYRVSSGELQRAMATSSDTDGAPWVIPSLGSWHTVVRSVRNASVFAYRDVNGAATTTPASVATAIATLTVSTASSPNRQFTYQLSVTPRSDA